MPHILITGGAGYIGAHTVHHLVAQGIPAGDIVVFDSLEFGHAEHLPKGVAFVQGNLLDKVALEAVFARHAFEGVIHFAAYAYVGESMLKPGKYFENNIAGGLNLLQAMQAHGCKRIVFSSTCATYGHPSYLPIDEAHPARPVNPYGESKLMFEKLLEWYGAIHGISSISLRYFNAAGAAFGIGEWHEPETHLIPLVIGAALGERDAVSINGTDYDTPDGTCIRDYVHVADLANAHGLALQLMQRSSHMVERINLGTGNGVSVRDVINTVRKISGRTFKVVEQARRPGDPASLVANPQKAGALLGWKAQHDINDIVRHAWAWHAQAASTYLLKLKATL